MMQATTHAITHTFRARAATGAIPRPLQAEKVARTQVGGYALRADSATAALVQVTPIASANKGWLAVYADLFKARLTSLVLLTTMVGFYVGFRGPADYGLLCRTLLGTALLAGGAAALNQWLEREYDAKMRRTQDRPLPSGRLQPQTVLVVGCGAALIGLVCLARGVNLTTSLDRKSVV